MLEYYNIVMCRELETSSTISIDHLSKTFLTYDMSELQQTIYIQQVLPRCIETISHSLYNNLRP